jgi:hypothetical protein
VRIALFEASLVRYGQTRTATRTAARKRLASVLAAHTRTETVLVGPLSFRRLVGPFHLCLLLSLLSKAFKKSATKVNGFSVNGKEFLKNICRASGFIFLS